MAEGQQNRRRLQDLDPEKRRLMLIGAAVAVGTFLFGFGVTALSFMRSGAPIDVVTVPDVRQMPVDEATRALDRSNLLIEIGDSFPNPTAPKGSVLAQAPLPGQEVSPETLIRVIVSSGNVNPIVPDVDDLSVALATQTLQAAGFDVLVEDAPGEGARGQVVGTIPRAGATVHLPATVRLRVGAPARLTEVPMLVGMNEQAARSAVESSGLILGEVLYVEGDEGEPNIVVGQDPPAGQRLPEGSSMQLRVTGLQADSPGAPSETVEPAAPEDDEGEREEGTDL